MKKVINAQERTVTFTFEGGLAPVVVHADRLSAPMQAYAVLHSIGHRVGDNAAIPKSAENGYTVTEAMRRAAVLQMADHMQSGTDAWDMKAGPRSAPLNPAILKLAERLNKTYEEAQAWFAAKLEAELAAE